MTSKNNTNFGNPALRPALRPALDPALGPAPATIAARAAVEADTAYGSVMPPLYLSSNYTFDGLGGKRQYDYTRSGNPTRDALAGALTELEGGAGAAVVSSGMAALTLVCQLLEPGQLLVAPHDCYGGTYRLLTALAGKGAFDVAFVDQTDDAALTGACLRRPRLILVETPSNPLLRIVDIEKVVALAKSGEGAAETLVVVDNTFLSPALQRPLELGADLVVHSTTKYLNGHSDVVGGAVIAGTPELTEELLWWANCLGITGSPFDSYQTLRGIRTLHARISQQSRSAGAIATFLQGHAGVAKVYYPGLPGHPGHAIAKAQQQGFGAIVSVEITGGEPGVRAFLDGLRYFSLAESLGGVESLIAHPATMTHAAMDEDARVRAGISDQLLRLSIGIEDESDLLADIEAGLARAVNATPQTPVADATPQIRAAE